MSEQRPTAQTRVLFICTANSSRSQMAEGLLRTGAGQTYEAFSAGTSPTHVRPEAITVMREMGIDLSGHRSKSVDEFAGQAFDYVITVCDNARETCPIFPATTKRMHWNIEDPAAVQGPEDSRLAAYRRVRDELQQHVKGFIGKHGVGQARG